LVYDAGHRASQMRALNVLLVIVGVAGAGLLATCSSSLSTPDGGSGGTGGQTWTGGASGTGATLATGGAGGTLALCGSALGGTNGLGGTSGLDASADARCAPNPLAGCPTSPASAPCGPGAVCAHAAQNGRVELQTCMPVPTGCDSCSCLTDAILDFAKQFPGVSIYRSDCFCYQGHQQVDGGTSANPISNVSCNGA
jgi:hypothetical protein